MKPPGRPQPKIARLQSWLDTSASRSTLRPRALLSPAFARTRRLKRLTQGFATACDIIRYSTHEHLHRVLVTRCNTDARPTRMARFLAPHGPVRWRSPRLWLIPWIDRVTTERPFSVTIPHDHLN
jgi:hypothetical protein